MAVDNEQVSQDKKNRFGMVVVVVVSLWVLLLAGLVVSLQFPAVQTRVVHKLSAWLSEKTGYPIEIGRVAISWLDELELENVRIYDEQDSLLIGMDQLRVNFDLLSLLRDNERIRVDAVTLNRPFVQLIRNTPDSSLNINGFIENLSKLFSTSESAGTGTLPFIIGDVAIEDGTFIFNDHQEDSIREGFDYYHFRINKINATTKEFAVIGDSLFTDIRHLTANVVDYNFSIDTLKTFFRYSSTGMLYDNLYLKAGNSILRDSVVFDYKSNESLSYFQDSVQLYANLKNSVLDSRDLAVFMPALAEYGDRYKLSGKLKGRVSQFDVKELDLRFGEKSQLKGFVSLDGLPNIMETFIELDLNNSFLHPTDMRPYLDAYIYENIQKLGNMQFSGQFLGFPLDFVANGTFQTWLGLIRSDINLKLHEERILSTYSGNLSLVGFQLGRFLEMPELLGAVTGQGSVEGQGLSIETAKLRLEASIQQMGIRGYPYRNIKTNGQLERSFFEGELSVKDPNLRVAGQGSVDLRNNKNKVKVTAKLDTANFRALGLMKDSLVLSTLLALDIEGAELNDITGTALMQNLYVNYRGRELLLDSLLVTSALDGQQRKLELQTDLVNLQAQGEFEYAQVTASMERLYEEYRLNFQNVQEDIREYYSRKDAADTYERYHLEYSLLLKDANPLLRLLDPTIYVSENTQVDGRLTGGYTSIFSANTTVDTLLWREHRLYDLEAELNTSKVADSTEVLAMAYLSSSQQYFNGIAPTRNLVTEAIWDRDHIEFTGNILQQEGDNYAALNGDLYFLPDETHIQLRNTETKLLNNIWRVAGDNLVILRGDEVEVRNLGVYHQDQFIRAEGILSPAPEDTLLVSVHDVQLANLNPILDQKLNGIVNGQLLLSELLDKPTFKGALKVDSLAVNEFLAGDFLLEADWKAAEEKLYLDIQGKREGQEILRAVGHYNPTATDNMLNLEARYQNAPLNLLEPFFGDMFSKIKGTTSGKILVLGTPSSPLLRGGGQVKGGSLRINYLNTTYSFAGDIVFTENEIGFRNLKLLDTEGNPAWLNGGVFHDGFSNFVIDLKARLQSTKVLNTTFSENELYYGTAYATGEVEVLGPANNLWISANARSEKGTKIYIPIDFKNQVGSQSFINFVSHSSDSTRMLGASSRQKVNTSGINLDFDLDITPDAYIEIIFDLRAGDIIRGRGNGKLELDINTDGDFTMVGNYEIQQGAYNFTLFNVITKEFIIEPGSNIRWDGDPYAGVLDIKARYEQIASLNRVIQASDGNAAAQRPYPVVLQMNLQGDMLSPAIDFDIEILDYPAEISNEVSGFLSRLQSDEQVMNRQVFNLLVLRQFAPVDYANNNFTASSARNFGSQTAISSISELLANQFTALANQIDENLQIDVNFNMNFDNQFQQDALNTFQLRLSYTFLNGRLRVTRDGSITSSSNPNPQATQNNLIGDWTVDLLLTPDGQYRIKFFNRTNWNSLSAEYQFANYTQGISFLQTKSFDTFKELIKKQKPEPLPPLPLPDSSPPEVLMLEEEERLKHPQQ